MQFFKVSYGALVLLLVTLLGCGGGSGGGGSLNDTVAPTVALTAPAPDATVSGVTTVSASAADDTAVTRVEFYVNGVLKKTATSAPFSFSWDSALLAKGSYTLSAKAYDAANNVGESAGVVVKVPISVSMSTAVSGSSAVGTVSLAGLATAEAFGLDVVVTMPAGTTIASPVASGVAASALAAADADGITVHLAGSSAFGSGEVLQINFATVPPGAVAGDFRVSLSSVIGVQGTPIAMLP